MARGSDVNFSKLNDVLFHSERALVIGKGLPRRPWYRHQIYAPGFYTGYGVKTLPGIREAVEAKNWPEATEETGSVAGVLADMDRRIQEATRLLQ
jgi:N-acetylated-alpha-linked acidic dipeptidase